LLLAACLLLFVLLLFESELILSGVSWAWNGTLATLRVHHTRTTLTSWASTTLHLCHLHLLHLLHLHWVHTTWTTHHLRVRGAIATVHTLIHHLLLHLLHLHRVHATHGSHGVARHTTAGLLLSESLLHGLEVLLHSLPVLSHHSRRHGAITALSLHVSAAVIVVVAATLAAVVAIVELVKLVSASELLAAIAAVVVAHVATGLGALDFNLLAEDLEGAAQSSVYGCIAIESNETETTGSTSLLVHHKCSIHNTTELLEEICKVFLGCFLADTTYENLASPFLLFTWNRTLGVNLHDVSR
jgi:hypothetical protein